MIDCDKLRTLAKLNDPASLEAINWAQEACGLNLPQDYIEMLLCSNGLLVNDDVTVFYPIEVLQDTIAACAAKEYLPESWLPIGNDSGDYWFFLDCSSPAGVVYKSEDGNSFPAYANRLAESLAEWMDQGFIHEESEVEYPELVDLYLLRPPTGGTKDLLKLKQELRLSNSLGELYKAQQNTPYRLARALPFWVIAQACQRYSETDLCVGLFEVDQADRPIDYSIIIEESKSYKP